MQSSVRLDVSEVVKGRLEIKKWAQANKESINVVNERMTKLGTNAPKQLKKVSAATQIATKRISRMGMQLQQAGYQVGDFAVQVQGGTNVMVALGQQGAQLLGIFGAGGAIAGAALAIGTAIVAPLYAARSEAGKLVDEMEALDEKIKDLRGNVLPKAYTDTLKEAETLHLQILDAETKVAEQKARHAKYQEDAVKGSVGLINSLGQVLSAESDLETLVQKRTDNYEQQSEYLKKVRESQELLAADERQRLLQEESMLELKLDGETSVADIKALQLEHAMENYEVDVKRMGLGPAITAELIAQQRAAFNLANELERASEADAFRDANLLRMLQFSYKDMGKPLPKPKAPKAAKKDALETLMKSLTLEKELLTVETNRAAVLRALGEDRSKYSAEAINQAVTLKAAIEEQTAAQEKQKSVADAVSGAFGDAMMGMIEGTKSVGDAFKSMASEIIRELYRIFVVKKITGMISSAITGVPVPTAGGGAANGGPVSGGRSYLVGERGPEMFTPSMGGGMVTPASQTNAGGVTIVQNINVSTGVQQTVRAEIRQMMPQIANSAKGAVLDAKRRGGSYGSAMA